MKKVTSTMCSVILCTALFATVNNVKPSLSERTAVSIKDSTPAGNSGLSNSTPVDNSNNSSLNGGNGNTITPPVNSTATPLNSNTLTPVNSAPVNPTNTNPDNNSVPLNSTTPVNGANGTSAPLNGTTVTPPTNGTSTAPPVK